MTGPLCLGLDVGSTLCKAVVCDPSGDVVAAARAPSPPGPHGPAPDRAALDAWWHAVCRAARAALSGCASRQIRAVGISCRHHPGIFLDASDGPVSAGPALPLTRTDPEVRDVYDADGWGPAGPFGHAYAPLLVGAARWLLRRYPEGHRRVRRAGTLRDYLGLRLCGEWVTDYATGPGGPEWPAAAAALAALPPCAFPVPRPMHACAGRIRTDAAGDLGLDPGTVVAVGAQDGACATYGAGATACGDGCITVSTNAVVRIVTGRIVPGVFGYPVAPSGAWAWVRGCPGAGRFLDAVVAALDGGPTPVEPARHAALAPPRDRSGAAAGQPFDLPDRAPETLAARIAELRARRWTPRDVYAAAEAAFVASLRRLAGDARALGLDAARYALTGGLTAVPALRARIGATLDRPTRVAREAAASGAARLGAVAAGIAAETGPAEAWRVRAP